MPPTGAPDQFGAAGGEPPQPDAVPAVQPHRAGGVYTVGAGPDVEVLAVAVRGGADRVVGG